MLGIYGIPLCECGCGKYVGWSKQNNCCWNNYIIGHGQKGKIAWNRGLTKETDARVAKISETEKGKFVSQETRNKISIANRKRTTGGMRGKKHSLESRRKMSMVAIGRIPWNKNKECSQSTRKKLSEFNKGKIIPQEVKDKMSASLMGHEVTQETRDKIADKQKGKFVSEQTRIAISCSLQNIPIEEWKGFVSQEPYCQIWTDEYKEFIKERDNYECQNKVDCRDGGQLCVHHIDYNKKNCDPRNLITACNSCHGRSNGNREYWEEFYSKIIREKYGT